MFGWLYLLQLLLHEAGAACRDARIRFLKAQVEILRRKLGGNRVIPNPDERLRLLAIGAELQQDVADVIGIVTPQTYSRWVVDQRESRKPKPVGRPKTARNLCELVKRLAKENAGWGYRRIIGELRKLRLRLGRSSVRRILKQVGLTPSPRRLDNAEQTIWRKFIRLHLNTLVTCDFFTKSVITPLGARLVYFLVVIHVGTRKVLLRLPTRELAPTGQRVRTARSGVRRRGERWRAWWSLLARSPLWRSVACARAASAEIDATPQNPARAAYYPRSTGRAVSPVSNRLMSDPAPFLGQVAQARYSEPALRWRNSPH